VKVNNRRNRQINRRGDGEERGKRNDETRIQGKKKINRQYKKHGTIRVSRKITREIKKKQVGKRK
jgi:hypothetical protein